MEKTYRFRKGQTHHIDEIYNVLSLIPNDAYTQRDPTDDEHCFSDDSSEYVTFDRDVTLYYRVD